MINASENPNVSARIDIFRCDGNEKREGLHLFLHMLWFYKTQSGNCPLTL
jgi:hypothetical protein